MADVKEEAKQEVEKEKLKEAYQIADKSTTAAVLLGIFISPVAYLYVRKWVLAAANVFTLNYLAFGIIIVPFHCSWIIRNARALVTSHEADED